jgi:hypothetical protein
MALLTVIVLLVVAAAWRGGRPLKIVLSDEEAKAVKARWWAAARGELKLWAICFPIGFALLWDPLAAAHWRPLVYVALAWASFLLFSRLAIWGTLAIGVLAYALLALSTVLGHPICQPIVVIGPIAACIGAILIRCVLTLVAGSGGAKSAPIITEQHAPAINETHNRS